MALPRTLAPYPLHRAIRQNNLPLFQTLLAHREELQLNLEARDEFGETPLKLAYLQMEYFLPLLEAGADPYAEDGERAEQYRDNLKHGDNMLTIIFSNLDLTLLRLLLLYNPDLMEKEYDKGIPAWQVAERRNNDPRRFPQHVGKVLPAIHHYIAEAKKLQADKTAIETIKKELAKEKSASERSAGLLTLIPHFIAASHVYRNAANNLFRHESTTRYRGYPIWLRFYIDKALHYLKQAQETFRQLGMPVVAATYAEEYVRLYDAPLALLQLTPDTQAIQKYRAEQAFAYHAIAEESRKQHLPAANAYQQQSVSMLQDYVDLQEADNKINAQTLQRLNAAAQCYSAYALQDPDKNSLYRLRAEHLYQRLADICKQQGKHEQALHYQTVLQDVLQSANTATRPPSPSIVSEAITRPASPSGNASPLSPARNDGSLFSSTLRQRKASETTSEQKTSHQLQP